VLFFGLILLSGILQWLVPLPWPWPQLSRWIGGAPAISAVAFAFWARSEFVRAGTNVNPRLPVSTIVASGAFLLTRNPMYLAMVVAFAGLTFALRWSWGFVFLPVLALVLHFGVVVREERYLEAKFGDGYREYRRRVRRWL
jgi:protein-S-isoprenylcysteine O-methyltransferase Ste14